MKRTLATIAVTIAATLTVAPVATHADAASHQRASWMNRTCATENSNNCFWSAKSGYAKGHPYYAHRIENVNCIMFADAAYAKHHDYCYDAS